MKTTSIRVPCRWHKHEDRTNQTGVACFQLGDGPCGKTVAALNLREVNGVFLIDQEHTDGSAKQFIYLRNQVTGRIEIEFAP